MPPDLEALQDMLAEYPDGERFEIMALELSPDAALQVERDALGYDEMLQILEEEEAYADTMEAHDRLPEAARRVAWGDDYDVAELREGRRRSVVCSNLQ
jgi:hypothetical protein